MNDRNDETNETEKDWAKSRLFVMNELNRHVKCLDEVGTKLDQILATLQEMKINEARFTTEFKIKSGFWGILGGAILVLIELVYQLLKNKF
jgi:hypothetical protein